MLQDILNEMLLQNQTTCNYAFKAVTVENSKARLNGQAASIGFIYRHVGETMNLFGYFFGIPTNVENTTMGKTDTGQVYDLEQSRQLLQQGYQMLKDLVEQSPDEFWLETIDTPFFGTIPRIRLFAHILYHNSHHAGQISMTQKRGQIIT